YKIFMYTPPCAIFMLCVSLLVCSQRLFNSSAMKTIFLRSAISLKYRCKMLTLIAGDAHLIVSSRNYDLKIPTNAIIFFVPGILSNESNNVDAVLNMGFLVAKGQWTQIILFSLAFVTFATKLIIGSIMLYSVRRLGAAGAGVGADVENAVREEVELSTLTDNETEGSPLLGTNVGSTRAFSVSQSETLSRGESTLHDARERPSV
ncbi:hypothetical protein GIB67_007342, partial [Kingdonia uniflora]